MVEKTISQRFPIDLQVSPSRLTLLVKDTNRRSDDGEIAVLGMLSVPRSSIVNDEVTNQLRVSISDDLSRAIEQSGYTMDQVVAYFLSVLMREIGTTTE